MRLKMGTIASLIIIVGAVAFTTAALRRIPKKPITVIETNQLPILQLTPDTDNSGLPVDITCRPTDLISQSSIGDVYCQFTNNSSKSIQALAGNINIIRENKGKEYITSLLLTIETFLHSDFRLYHHHPIAPGGTETLENNAINFDQGVVTKVSVRINYIEYDDGSTLGSDKAGQEHIQNIRDGAAKYKVWLVHQYLQSNKSPEIAIQLLQTQELPVDLELVSGQKVGARQYRSHLLQTYRDYGAMEVTNCLNRQP